MRSAASHPKKALDLGQSQSESAEPRLIRGREPVPRKSILSRLRSKILTRLWYLKRSRSVAWVRTLWYECRSFYFHIQEVRKKDLVDRIRSCPSCEFCRTHGIPSRCKADRACIDHIERLRRVHPWLSYSDMQLILEGWTLAFQLTPYSQKCDTSIDSAVVMVVAVVSANETCKGGNSMPPEATQQGSKHDRSTLLPSRE